jgi:hypothetical protein
MTQLVYGGSGCSFGCVKYAVGVFILGLMELWTSSVVFSRYGWAVPYASCVCGRLFIAVDCCLLPPHVQGVCSRTLWWHARFSLPLYTVTAREVLS